MSIKYSYNKYKYSKINVMPLNKIPSWKWNCNINTLPSTYCEEEKERKKVWKRARDRAYRKLKGKVPPGWKLRVSFKRNRYFKNGSSAIDLAIALGENKYFVTATKYLGGKGEPGFPYLKCLLHPSEGFTWTLSNWANVNALHRSANIMLATSEDEMNQVRMCMESLQDMMSDDPLIEIKGNAISSNIPMWASLLKGNSNEDKHH